MTAPACGLAVGLSIPYAATDSHRPRWIAPRSSGATAPACGLAVGLDYSSLRLTNSRFKSLALDLPRGLQARREPGLQAHAVGLRRFHRRSPNSLRFVLDHRPEVSGTMASRPAASSPSGFDRDRFTNLASLALDRPGGSARRLRPAASPSGSGFHRAAHHSSLRRKWHRHERLRQVKTRPAG